MSSQRITEGIRVYLVEYFTFIKSSAWVSEVIIHVPGRAAMRLDIMSFKYPISFLLTKQNNNFTCLPFRVVLRKKLNKFMRMYINAIFEHNILTFYLRIVSLYREMRMYAMSTMSQQFYIHHLIYQQFPE